MTSTERASSIVIWVMAIVAVVFLLTPLVVTVIVSFGSSPVFTLPPAGWSTRWYERLPATQGLLSSVLASVQIAALLDRDLACARNAVRDRPGARPVPRTRARSRPCWSRR